MGNGDTANRTRQKKARKKFKARDKRKNPRKYKEQYKRATMTVAQRRQEEEKQLIANRKREEEAENRRMENVHTIANGASIWTGKRGVYSWTCYICGQAGNSSERPLCSRCKKRRKYESMPTAAKEDGDSYWIGVPGKSNWVCGKCGCKDNYAQSDLVCYKCNQGKRPPTH